MKTKIIIVLTMLLSVTAFAQNGINYKALIKDNLGNVVANQSVTIRFSILKGVAQTNQYTETHNPTTDANGIVVVNIGEGTLVSGNFNTILWNNDTYSLNTQINTGSGLVDMGTTEFKTVPYALSAANVQGLEKINEGIGFGWRLIGSNPDNFGSIGSNAIDLSKSFNPSATVGATGNASTALGVTTTASGNLSTAMGISTIASGYVSTAMGNVTSASGENSTSMGTATSAQGNYTTSMGLGTIAIAYANTAMGHYNLGGGSSLINWVTTDPLFEVGNGTPSVRSNALTILKNGTITAPSLTNALITTAGAKALITKEYADTNLVSTGLEALNEGVGIGWRLKGSNPDNFGNIGLNAVDLSKSLFPSTTVGATGSYSTAMGDATTASGDNSTAMGLSTTALGVYSTAMGNATTASGFISTAMGWSTTASGDNSTAMGLSTTALGVYSTAMGYSTTASGDTSTAMGRSTTASGEYSTAMGRSTTAAGPWSTAMGNSTTASGDFSTAMGRSTIASGYASTAIGRYNVGGGNTTAWVATDPLFEIGNGTSVAARANALSVLKNGNVGISGYTQLGKTSESAPAIKIKKLTLNTPNAQGAFSFIAHGVTQSKILSISALATIPGGFQIIPNHEQAGLKYTLNVDNANIAVGTVAGNSGSILNMPVKILVTYEE